MTTLSKVFIGVDVSKNKLDIFVYPLGKSLKINNSKQDITKFIKQLSAYEVMQVVCEATGGYEKLLKQLLQQNCLNCWVVDPRRIKGFIASTGCKSKTDCIDAQKIAEFASIHSLDYEVLNKSLNEEYYNH